jgi:hypothetical protein
MMGTMLLALLLVFGPGILAQESNPVPGSSQPLPAINQRAGLELELTVSTRDAWIDTGLDLHAGDQIALEARRESGLCDAAGSPQENDQDRDLPLGSAPFGALIARFGSFGAAPQLVGRKAEFTIAEPGHLFLGTNSDGEVRCLKGFVVAFKLQPAEIARQASGEDWLLNELIDRMPRRVKDAYGNPGDMVNFVLIGSTESMIRSFTDAGWVIADRKKMQAAMHAAVETMSHKDYVEMPMSELLLLGRVQDYGWEQAEAYKVVACRHHFRVWEAPFKIHGQAVWLGAGTHDIGFDQDHRNGHVTHKIDPAIDGERDYIVDTLRKAGALHSLVYERPSTPFTKGKNATGGAVISDGRIALITIA